MCCACWGTWWKQEADQLIFDYIDTEGEFYVKQDSVFSTIYLANWVFEPFDFVKENEFVDYELSVTKTFYDVSPGDTIKIFNYHFENQDQQI